MRISDWSSDVCSSDLGCAVANRVGRRTVPRHLPALLFAHPRQISPAEEMPEMAGRAVHHPVVDRGHSGASAFAGQPRSAEHTSELQSLMRISYAVFCLKTKKYTTTAY